MSGLNAIYLTRCDLMTTPASVASRNSANDPEPDACHQHFDCRKSEEFPIFGMSGEGEAQVNPAFKIWRLSCISLCRDPKDRSPY